MAEPMTLDMWLMGCVRPVQLLYMAIKSFFLVLLETLTKRNRNLSAVKDEAFSRFWDQINPPPDPNQPLEGSAALIPPLLATAKGVVLELGPGSGVQVKYFAKASPWIDRIYGAEPCAPLHAKLMTHAWRADLSDKYTIVTAGAEKETLIPGLAKAGLLAKAVDEDGLFDTIVCVRVLCSVNNLKETGETIYKLLKPGGRLLVVEHVKNPWRTAKGSIIARALQTVLTWCGWSFFVGNCHLKRDTRRGLIEAAKPFGGWEEVDLSYSFASLPLPYVSGSLTKRKD